MGKRTLDDVENPVELTPEVNGDLQLSKKLKKEKKDKKDKKAKIDIGENGTIPVLDLEDGQEKTQRNKEKKEKKRKLKDEGEIKDSAEGEAKLTKEERKALKAAKKEKKRQKKELEENGGGASGINDDKTTLSTIPYPTPAASVPSTNGTSTPVELEISATKYLSDNAITVFDPEHPDAKLPLLHPVMSFSSLPSTNKDHLKPFATYKVPTPIQSISWPYLLAKRDLIGVAETGSGKTMAFAYPAIRYLLSLGKKAKAGAKVVVVSPTRELAMQIFEQIESVAAAAGFRDAVVCVYGGVPKDPQRDALRKATIIVATPGRLVDFLEEGAADISSAGYVVLDEADRMLDKGFEDAIKTILSKTPATPNRQTLMFTATWPQSVRQLAATFMTKPVKIGINTPEDGDLRANTRITQTVHVIDDPRSKESRLLSTIQAHQRSSANGKNDRILVFALYKKEATRIELFLRGKGVRVGGIHGDLNQAARTAALAEFKKGTTPVLVATDVAARGLDIPNVKMVINVTFPLTVEDYVHRIGRTGRAGETGIAITFFTEHDKAHSGSLINVLKAANQPVPEELMKFGTTVKKKEHSVYGAFYRDTEGAKAATKIKFDD